MKLLSTKRSVPCCLALFTALAFAAPAQAADVDALVDAFVNAIVDIPPQLLDSLTLQGGGNDHLQSLRLGATRHWNQRWFADGHWHMTGYWEADVGVLRGTAANGRTSADVGFAPVLRFRPNANGGAQPYWEAGIGLRLLSHPKLDDAANLGTAVQVANHLGVGLTFGDKTRFDVAYRMQHLSNPLAETDRATLHQIRLSYLY